MKKSKRVILLIALSLIVVISSISLCGCSNLLQCKVYENEESYLIGNGEVLQTVKSIEINWINGSVNFVLGESKIISVEESADRELVENEKIRYGLFDETLKIQFAASGYKFENKAIKTLTVTVPNGVAFENITINGVSCNVSLGDVNAKTFEIYTVSGNIDCKSVDSEIQSLKLESVSGKISLKLNGYTSDLKIDSVSGNVEVILNAVPNVGNVKTVSGTVDLSLNENSDIAVSFKTVSGIVNNSLKCENADEAFIFGTGEKSFSVKTVSGNLNLSAA